MLHQHGKKHCRIDFGLASWPFVRGLSDCERIAGALKAAGALDVEADFDDVDTRVFFTVDERSEGNVTALLLSLGFSADDVAWFVEQ